jgi:hypothetical protein
MSEIFGDRRIQQFGNGGEIELPNPLEVHIAESRWQTCNCRTCQEKRLKYDAMPGKKIDWERYRRTAGWDIKAIFYIGGGSSE